MKKKFNSKNIVRQAENVGILLCITLLIVFVVSFMNAFHNVDLVMNMQTMVNGINEAGLHDDGNLTLFIPFEDIKDTGSDYVTRQLSDYYIPSMNNLKKYFILSLIDLMLLGLLLGRRL